MKLIFIYMLLFLTTLFSSECIKNETNNKIVCSGDNYSVIGTKKIKKDTYTDYYEFGGNFSFLNENVLQGLKEKREKWFQSKIDPLITKWKNRKKENMKKYNLGENQYNKLMKKLGVSTSDDGNPSDTFSNAIVKKITGVDQTKINEMLEKAKEKIRKTNKSVDLKQSISEWEKLSQLRKGLSDAFFDEDNGMITNLNKESLTNKAFGKLFGEDWEEKYKEKLEEIKKFEKTISGEYLQESINEAEKKYASQHSNFKELLDSNGQIGVILQEKFTNMLNDPNSGMAKKLGLDENKQYNLFSKKSIEMLDSSFQAQGASLKKDNLCDLVKCYKAKTPNEISDCEEKGMAKSDIKEQLKKLRQQIIVIAMIKVLKMIMVNLALDELMDYVKKIPQCVLVASYMSNFGDSGDNGKVVNFMDVKNLQRCTDKCHPSKRDTKKGMALGVALKLETYTWMSFDLNLPTKVEIEAEAYADMSFAEAQTFSTCFEKCNKEGASDSWLTYYDFCMKYVKKTSLGFQAKKDLFLKTTKVNLTKFKRASCQTYKASSDKKSILIPIPFSSKTLGASNTKIQEFSKNMSVMLNIFEKDEFKEIYIPYDRYNNNWEEWNVDKSIINKNFVTTWENTFEYFFNKKEHFITNNETFFVFETNELLYSKLYEQCNLQYQSALYNLQNIKKSSTIEQKQILGRDKFYIEFCYDKLTNPKLKQNVKIDIDIKGTFKNSILKAIKESYTILDPYFLKKINKLIYTKQYDYINKRPYKISELEEDTLYENKIIGKRPDGTNIIKKEEKYITKKELVKKLKKMLKNIKDHSEKLFVLKLIKYNRGEIEAIEYEKLDKDSYQMKNIPEGDSLRLIKELEKLKAEKNKLLNEEDEKTQMEYINISNKE